MIGLGFSSSKRGQWLWCASLSTENFKSMVFLSLVMTWILYKCVVKISGLNADLRHRLCSATIQCQFYAISQLQNKFLWLNQSTTCIWQQDPLEKNTVWESNTFYSPILKLYHTKINNYKILHWFHEFLYIWQSFGNTDKPSIVLFHQL